MALTLEVAYADAGALVADAASQLARGGLYVAVDASALPPLAELMLRLVVDGGASFEAPVRLTVATAEAACVELSPEAREALLAAIAAANDGVVAGAGDKRVRIYDPADKPAGDEADKRGQIPIERRLAVMSVGEKIQLALHGNREMRTLLMRDRAGVVQSSLVRNPKITLDEIQALARAPQLSPETAETLAQHPTYGASASIALALVRNPRTSLPTAIALVNKLNPTDLRAVAKGVGVRMQVAAAARKRLIDPPR